ncbi:hypothetical protein, partial [Ferrimicrobium sp.]
VTENAATTIDMLLTRWLTTHGGDIAGSTLVQYEWATRHITKRLGPLRIERLTPAMVDRFVDQLA